MTWVSQVHGSGLVPRVLTVRPSLSKWKIMLSAASMYQRSPCRSKRSACAPSNIFDSSPHDRMVPPVQREDVAVRRDGHAAEAPKQRVGRIVEEVVDQMEVERGNRRTG